MDCSHEDLWLLLQLPSHTQGVFCDWLCNGACLRCIKHFVVIGVQYDWKLVVNWAVIFQISSSEY